MKVSQPAISSALASIVKLTGKRTTIPALNCVHVRAREGVMLIRATDIDCDATVNVECGEGEIDACVNGQKFFAFCNAGSGDIDLDKRDSKVIAVNGSRIEMPTVPLAEFPHANNEKNTGVGVNTADLAKAIRGVLFACDTGSQDILCETVFVTITDREIRAFALRRTIIAIASIQAIAAPCAFAVPAKSCEMLCATLEMEEATFWISDKHVTVIHKRGRMSAVLSTAKAPNWELLTKKTTIPVGKFFRAPLLSEVRHCLTFITDIFSNEVTLAFGKKLKISTNKSDFQYAGSVEFDSEPFEAVCNAKLLSECLNAFESETLILSTQEDKHLVFTDGELTVYLALIGSIKR